MTDPRATFQGSIPQYYDDCLGQAYFGPPAAELVRRVPSNPGGDVLEIACGTGQVTRRLRARLDRSVKLVASDLSPAMVAYARAKVGEEAIEWREADAQDLPFPDGTFGAVACALGFMFLPDKPKGMAEACRVLKPGGLLAFSVWDRKELNPTGRVGAAALESLKPGDPDLVFSTQYGMADPAMIRALASGAGFRDLKIESVQLEVSGVSARTIATGMVRGTPRSNLIAKKGFDFEQVIDVVAAALAKSGGADSYRAPSRVILVEARK
jgi:ubiquinone/menaquinone biosynthesis C-methylase UbiE